jgi:hypothetical protein
MAHPATAKEGQLVLFDLILSGSDDWSGQNMVENVEQRLVRNKLNKSSFPCTISVPNFAYQRSLFNKTAYRNRMKMSCNIARRLDVIVQPNLFDFFYPVRVQPAPQATQAASRYQDKQKKIHTLHQTIRRWKAKFETLRQAGTRVLTPCPA